MKKSAKLLCLMLSVVLLFTLLAGCGNSGGKSATDKDTFIVGLDSDIVKLDPAFAYDFTTNPVVNQISQALLDFDNDNQLQPLLAKSWEQTDDLTYVYQIRDDVTFSDGSAMTMDDVIFSMERVRDPELASYLGWMYDNVDTIVKTGDWELTVKLVTPDATWQYVPATTACHVLKKEFVESKGDSFGTSEGGMIGTGPYTYVSWKNGTEVVLKRNDNYWNKDETAHFENLVFKIITEDTTRVTALQSGDIDCIVPAPASMISVMEGDANITLTSAPGFGVTFTAFNTEKAPFDNADVRRAISMAIDFDDYYTNLVGKTGDAPTALPSSNALFTIESARWESYAASAPKYSFDVEGAKALLAGAGYPDGFDCVLTVSEDSLRGSIALAMQENLKAVGINMEIKKVSNDEHTAYQFGDILDSDGLRDYDMIMAGWEADYPDPSGNLVPLYQGGNSSNTAAYDNATVTELLAQQAAESDPSVRNDLMFQALDIITEDMPYLFMFYPIKTIAINKDYTGLTMNASWIWNIHFQNVKPVA